ncbi:uncharacterized protein NFIA_073320 [Aspergillus fischeri NRRL 181]|uniref:Uncharacterized protein n=1 Tax=Neosartorya fischeri (strain ATCC 1020 / DSM 3700 / CBS 544.65 / FGSC A1164 / JCM 1740 / NRRL 181 / WB 181) TaxID=331117 RepID=A1DDG0_NEOFI|nr:uncharacterized protein NFIA_073320 [Aspergillus fischeri NRRL 181]EAW17417.1 hypothetical protein NFIA_073320 [Aspergillus fischeri NRRL 181]
MHLSPWAIATFITAATAATLKVNYYSDGGCSDYMASINPSPGFSCYDYVWTGSNSVNIADCTFPNGKCICTFYTQPHSSSMASERSGLIIKPEPWTLRILGPNLQGVGGRLWERVVRARENERGIGFNWQGDGGEKLDVVLPFVVFPGVLSI